MAVSGSKDYSITRANIIEAALRKLGVYDQGEAVSGDETSAAATALNLMVKEWVARGIDLWLRDEITLFLQPDTKSYSIGTDHATRSHNETTLSTSASSGATALTVGSTSGMAASDNIGVKLDSNTIHWDTISTVDSTTTLTLTTGLASAASSGKKVYAYTTKAGRPQKIVYAYRRDKNDIDNEVSIIGEKEYMRQSNKGSSGPPVEVWYHPTLTTGTLYVWPVDGGASWDKLILSAQYLPDDFDAASDNPQFPIEWGNALVWNLAAELAAEYQIPRQDRAELWAVANAKLSDALDYDVENASVEFAMDYER